jgi:hypothetical protein
MLLGIRICLFSEIIISLLDLGIEYVLQVPQWSVFAQYILILLILSSVRAHLPRNIIGSLSRKILRNILNILNVVNSDLQHSQFFDKYLN